MSGQGKEKIAILVAGMHRSGTSLLTRVLNISGCDLPATLLEANPTNETGHWESRKIVFLNDEILASAGSSWRDWNPFNPQWYASPVAGRFCRRAQEALVDEFGDSPFFVLKDPRICRLLPFWIEAVRAYGAEPMIVSPIRNPLDVAASLEKRDGIAPSIGHLLWLRHVLDAEKDTRGMKRAWLLYNALLSEPYAMVDAIGDALGVSWPRSTSVDARIELDEFVCPSIRHHWSSDAQLLEDPRLSHWIKSTFDIFNRWCGRDVHDEDVEELDRVRSAFDAALPAFSYALASSDRALAERDGQIGELRQALVARDARVEELDRAVVERDGQIGELRQALVARDARVEELDRAVVERDGQIGELRQALVARDARVEELDRAVVERDGQIGELRQTLAARDARVEELDRAVVERDGQIGELRQTLAARDARVEELDRAVVERDGQIGELRQALVARDARVEELDRAAVERDRQIGELYGSTSWRITAPLRRLRRSSRLVLAKIRAGSSRIAGTIYHFTPLPVSVKTRFKETIFRLAPAPFRHMEAYQRWEGMSRHIVSGGKMRSCTSWGILATPHTLFVARSIERRLRGHGWNVHLMTEPPDEFSHDFYVVICPHMFKKLPSYEKLISFQMEQSVSTRWFNDRYLTILNNSFAVLEYATHNFSFLKSKGLYYPHIHYLPIGGQCRRGDTSPPIVKACDVLFYGDNLSSPRRQHMLSALKMKFDVQVENDTFGLAMERAIRSARIIINLHYYEDALLEVPRIWECLSLGTPVVSEDARDRGNYPELEGVVNFFEQGSVSSMIFAVEEALENPVSEQEIYRAVETSSRRFSFMFDRFLLAMDFLPSKYVKEIDLPVPESANRIILSMPETYERQRAILVNPKLDGWTPFAGIRRSPGWIGCGLSYQALARHAMWHDLNRLAVIEDDVVLPEDFPKYFKIVNQFLDQRIERWTLFSGLIADLHENVKILSVEKFEGMTFVTIDKMTSTVFNLYSLEAMKIIELWNPENLDLATNTIDRFIENQKNLRIITTIPYLVRLDDNLDSILWKFSNKEYSETSMHSENKLREMASAFSGSMNIDYRLEETENEQIR